MDLTQRIHKEDLKKPFDLIIIGGGINGAATARDAAERGLRVLLLEKEDYAYGCSSHSTRLIHGGLRYLEHFEFALVQESLEEREILLRNYPHLVQPLELCIPVYSYSRNGLLKLNAGMMLYDFFSQGKSMPNYRPIPKSKMSQEGLQVKQENLKGAVAYFDGQSCFVERICLENILSAEELGAFCLNHCEVTEVQVELKADQEIIHQYGEKVAGKTDDKSLYKVTGVRFKDKLNGNLPYTATAKRVINMAGPGVDIINEKVKQSDNFYPTHPLGKLIGGTKGSHIVVEEFPGAPRDKGIYVEAKSDGRPFFILPFKLGTNDPLYLIGTTDIYLSAEEAVDPYTAQISEAEIDYLIKETNNLFPQARLEAQDVIKTFCGVRPLPYVDEKTNPGAITRRHFIHNHGLDNKGIENYYSVIGGKITTFRNLAKEIVDQFTSVDCLTHNSATVSSNFDDLEFTDYIKQNLKTFLLRYPKLESQTVMHLLMLYGSRAEEVMRLTIEEPELAQKLDPDFEDIAAQVVFAIRKEHAYTIEDIVNRRLTIGLSLDKISLDLRNKIQEYLNRETELNKRRIRNR